MGRPRAVWQGVAFAGALVIGAAGAKAQITAGSRAPSPPLTDLTWRCIGPFEGGPVSAVAGVAGEPGVYIATTPSGFPWKTVDGGDSWVPLERGSVEINRTESSRWTDPANPRRVVRTETNGIAVSLDGGETWAARHNLPNAQVAILEAHEHPTQSPAASRTMTGSDITVSIADSVRPGLIFAGTRDSMLVSFDNGGTWRSLQLNLPPVPINDLDIRGNKLVAATQGRSIWELDDISPLRQTDPARASAPAIVFKPAGAVAGTSVYLDYYLGAPATGAITLDVIDSTGRVVHSASSAAPDPADRWLPVARPLATTAGHHRVMWNLRLDPPPSPHHRFARFAPALFEDDPAEPDGPALLAGAYRVRLTVGGRSFEQPLVVRDDPKAPPAQIQAQRQQFALSMQTYDAMEIAHRGYLQLKRVRDQLKPLLTSADPDLAAIVTDLDARLNTLDGSDWSGLVMPDADDEVGEVDEAKEGKHPDFVPPKAVSLSKDYDDPTSVLGRNFGNVDHAPAFAILGNTLGEMLTHIGASGAPDAAAVSTYTTSCQQLASVLDAWRGVNTLDLPQLNAQLAQRKLSALPVAPSVPAIACPR